MCLIDYAWDYPKCFVWAVLRILDIFNIPDFVPLLFAVDSWFHDFITKSCFSDQGEVGGVSKGEASAINAIARVAAALKIMGAVTGVDVVLTLACEGASVTDAAPVRRHFVFTGSTESDKDGWSPSFSFQRGIFSPRMRDLKEDPVHHLSGRGIDQCLLLFT